MTIERAKQILSSYGGSVNQWPANERSAMQNLLLSNAELQALLRQEQQLDREIAQFTAVNKIADIEDLERKILQSLPERKATVASNSVTGAANKTLLGRIRVIVKQWDQFVSPTWAVSTAAAVVLMVISIVQFNALSPQVSPSKFDTDDELQLMAEALDNSNELALLVMLEPELASDDPEVF